MIHRLRPYALAVLTAVLTVFTLVQVWPQLDVTTVALVMVLVVTFDALVWKSGPALCSSLLFILSFNYFFLPPYDSFNVVGRQDVVASIAFAAIAVIMGQLSARAEKRAEQAEARRIEIETLYVQLQKANDEAAEAELLRRSERLKTAVLDAVTHDLRTPLTSIKAAVTTILSELPRKDEFLRDLLQIIDEESDRLNRFIQEMMDLAQLEAGSTVIQHADISVSEIVESALERAEPILADHLIDVSLQQRLPHLLVDPSAISQVLYTLLDNAAKYSPAGSRIAISAKSDGPSILVTVCDQGSGIPPEFRDRVFDKFFRVASGDTRPGFGLGLSIARAIVEAHNGKIWIADAAAGGGTAITFSVPFERAVAGVRPHD